jgi:hypothetical protein
LTTIENKCRNSFENIASYSTNYHAQAAPTYVPAIWQGHFCAVCEQIVKWSGTATIGVVIILSGLLEPEDIIRMLRNEGAFA